jgi:aspartate 1-decarboxylase
MRFMARTAAVVALAVGLAAVLVAADEVTLEGKIACAKCTLKKADAKECQNVLLVKDADGKTAEYYIVVNEAAEKFGEVCTNTTDAKVTGTVSEKDGRKWITASKVEATKS